MRRRTSLFLLIGSAAATVCFAIALWRTGWRDPTVGLPPQELVRAASVATLEAKGYRFTVELVTGPSRAGEQVAVMRGGYQRSPQRLHLIGSMKTGAGALDLEYYISDEGAMMRMGEEGAWRSLYGPEIAQVRSFQPDELARVLRDQVSGAMVIRREAVLDQPAVLIRPSVSGPVPWARPRAGTAQGGLEYRLWIATRTLFPIRLEIISRGEPGFQYRIDWDFSSSPAIRPPAGAAAPLSQDQ